MKKAIALCLFLVLVGTAQAQTRAPRSGPDPSIQPFWEEFKTAVIKGDKDAVANLSRFPIRMPHRKKVIKTGAELIQRYREVFSQDTDAAKCFGKAVPVNYYVTTPNEFEVGCSHIDESRFYPGEEPVVYKFTLTRNGWRFTRLDFLSDDY